ncbi:anoctamin-3 isoform X5 [Dendroctonus ponderosae]|uniref:anoctamin-3 isoform X5 n=1 Tax=Dendroctonus ponderosae TaxID=77166 RepID=UPI002034E468|nr:anoctamin-3 isoform X5 [Dendroctonus ponderosae]
MSDTHEQHDNVAKVVSEKSALLRSFSTPEVQISRLPSPQSCNFRDIYEDVVKERCHSRPTIVIQRNSTRSETMQDESTMEQLDSQPYSENNKNDLKLCCESKKKKCPRSTVFFQDGLRSVDFVLVWHTVESDSECDASEKRRIFEKNLIDEGLDLEYENQESSKLKFVKIHAPLEVLRRYGEILKLRMPMKEGDLTTENTVRNLLYTEWACLGKWYRYQPLDCIKEYFGVKIALYFAWLGYYTHILLAPAIVGLACFIYSLATMYSHKPSNDICDVGLEEKMCPHCDIWCDYWNIKETCVHSRITYLFDNSTTVFYAVFMSLWATTFLEMWKRYSAEITHRWDLTGFDVQEEHPRPQYLARLAHVKRKCVNIITNTMEPHVPFWKIKVPMTIFSFGIVLLLVCMALATVLAVVLYRMSILVSLKVHSDKMDNSSAILFTTVTAASINLVAILIFNQIYNYVAEYLTEFELLRTQTEFDDSLTLKIYLLQFVNYYASIFYIAFFKGKFVGSPKRYNRVFGYRQEECGPGGCLLELCIQLAVIMIGKQAMNTVLEMLFPLFFKWLNTLKAGFSRDHQSCKGFRPRWVKDFKLVEWGPRSLFPEYLEMVLQYGFVTIFVAAFPLAPFFALLNNILEMRLDAKKLLTMYRRPVSQRVRDIGVWYRILDSIGKLSVVTNGFIIAFTSDFIPRLVYQISINPNGSLEGYVNNSLSYFNTSDFEAGRSGRTNNSIDTVCRYPDYRNPPWSSEKYERTALYWHILAARFIFVVVFENLVVLVMIILKWCIPDMPGKLRDRIRREAYITNEIIIKQETLRAQRAHSCSNASTLRKPETLQNIDVPSTPEQWDRLISSSLSQSEFDLVVHGDEHQTGSHQINNPATPQSI